MLLRCEKTRELYADVKAQIAATGRDPDHLLVLSGLFVPLGRTQAEAEEKLAVLDRLVDPIVGLERLAFREARRCGRTSACRSRRIGSPARSHRRNLTLA